MTSRQFRRSLLLTIASAPLVSACSWFRHKPTSASLAAPHLQALEAASGGRLGVAALNTANDAVVEYKANERFPFCSTFKVMVVAAILKRSSYDNILLGQRIRYAQNDLVNYSPITEKHLADGLTVAELCAAALQYSDNTAGNLLIRILGGPAGITTFARQIGDNEFRLDRWETELNSAIPGDQRDTTTPAAMTQNLQRLVVADALAQPQQEQLQNWMLGNTTGDMRIRAGVPKNWQIADKTGSGDYGTTNDIAVIWPLGKPPIVLSVYFTQHKEDAGYRNDIIASAARIVVSAFK